MSIQEFVRQLKLEFLQNRIATKTGWGKNDIEKAFVEAINKVLMAHVDGTRV